MINIFICANKKYIDIATTTLFSIRYHTDEPMHCYVCQKGVEQGVLLKFADKLRNYKIDCTVIEFALDGVDERLLHSFYPATAETFYRLFAQFILPSDLDRVLYVDSDMVALGDVSSFYHQDFGNHLLVACQDIGDVTGDWDGLKESVGVPKSSTYFNAGVLLINLQQLRGMSSIPSVLDTMEKIKDKWLFYDQDVLNVKYGQLTKIESYRKYNYHGKISEKLKMNDETVLLHYAGAKKPWSPKGIFERNANFYWYYKIKQSPFALLSYVATVLAIIPHACKKLASVIFHLFFPNKHPLQR